MSAFLELASRRYSVRSFKDRAVEADKVARILEAARVAPTACNNQPQRVKVIADAEGLAKADECTPCRFAAPLVMLVCYDKTVCWSHPASGQASGEIDAAIVTAHLMMAAEDIGLGSCWVMKFDRVQTTAAFALPENIVPVAFLPIGYPADDAEPSEQHRRKASSELEKILL